MNLDEEWNFPKLREKQFFCKIDKENITPYNPSNTGKDHADC